MTKKCEWCGKEIQNAAPNRHFCDECRKLKRQQLDRIRDRRKKLRKRVLVVDPLPKKTISDIVRDILAYNKKHGTHLTYGQYIGKLQTGTLKD